VELPLYIEICTSLDANAWTRLSRSESSPDVIWTRLWQPRWVSIGEIRPPAAESVGKQLVSQPVPAYLLARRPPTERRPRYVGITCLPGAVRDHLSAEQIAQWAERLAACSSRLVILDGNSRECAPDADARASMLAHLIQQGSILQAEDAERAQLSADWEAERSERAALDKQVLFEAQRGCGLRLHEPGTRSPFREGDIVYHPPPANRSTQGGVAVVFEVRRGWVGSRRLPLDEFNLLMWDVQRLKFTRLERDVLSRDFILMPPCCGRGAACAHLLLTQFGRWQWPNGDDLDLRVLRPIPEAFSGLLSNELRAGSWQQRRALQETFKTLRSM